jgi:hypothetical protein
MRFALLTAALTILALPALEGVALGQTTTASPVIGPWQNNPNTPQVPFPVINPLQGLNTGLTHALQGQQTQVNPAPYGMYTAPVATPPQNLPPGVTLH